MQVTINGKMNELKFNFKALFKANNDYSSEDNQGNKQGDGALLLFTRLVSDDVTVIPDIIRVAGGFNKINDDNLFDAIEELTDGGENIDSVMQEMKDEMKNSGFFIKNLNQGLQEIEESLPTLETTASAEQFTAVKRIHQLLKDNL